MNTATYCPEDNKLRLYVGRVPRDEYLALRADGWTSTPKQSCDFVATWTPSRRDTALDYAGVIDDEDQPPEERAADRAERFGGYRDKRTDEATGHADRYDAGPQVHGYQNQARAERAAVKHDRIAARAGDAWSKAEYWQRRTAGVISHALYKSTPGVRMGRIKVLEAELRKWQKTRDEYNSKRSLWEKCAAMADTEKQNALAYKLAYVEHGDYTHPRTGRKSYLFALCKADEDERNIDPLNGAELCAVWLADNPPLKSEPGDWESHYMLRLAYENQMLEAQGGRLEQCEVLVGGKLGGKLIIKVSKSTATGRPTSADILGPKVTGWTYKATNIPGTEFAAYKFDLERLSPDAYTPPTPESLAELKAFNDARKAALKANAEKNPKPPLINPTDADAERLQKMWNDRIRIAGEQKKAKDKYSYVPEFEPAQIVRMTQALYSARSKGTYTRCQTADLCAEGKEYQNFRGCYEQERKDKLTAQGPIVCQVRTEDGKNYMADCVIILTDKPQKPLPAAVWEAHKPAPTPEPSQDLTCSNCSNTTPRADWTPSGSVVFTAGIVCPSCGMHHEGTNDNTTAAVNPAFL